MAAVTHGQPDVDGHSAKSNGEINFVSADRLGGIQRFPLRLCAP
jgi:hypothetical protein